MLGRLRSDKRWWTRDGTKGGKVGRDVHCQARMASNYRYSVLRRTTATTTMYPTTVTRKIVPRSYTKRSTPRSLLRARGRRLPPVTYLGVKPRAWALCRSWSLLVKDRPLRGLRLLALVIDLCWRKTGAESYMPHRTQRRRGEGETGADAVNNMMHLRIGSGILSYGGTVLMRFVVRAAASSRLSF